MDFFLIVVGIFVFLFFILMLLTHWIIKKRFYRGSYPKGPTAERFYKDFSTRYSRRPISFYSGKHRLQGYVYGEENTQGMVVFAHGIGVGHETYIKELLWLVDQGWCVLAYDATGSCESEGDSTGGLVQSALDLHAALSWVEREERLSHLPVCLMGHSWGGYAVAAVLAFGHNVRASASISGYSDPLRMIAEFARSNMGRATCLLIPFVWLWMRMRHGRLGSLTAIKGINKSDVPVLLIHGTEDELVTLETVSIVREASNIKNPNVQMLLVDAKGQSGHGSIFRHSDSTDYIEGVEAALKALKRDRGDAMVPEDLERFFSEVDKELYNRPNEELLLQIHEFFLSKMPE
ncbi:MAG: alpha/beta fold hydrolase [Ruminococcaceae bacterium]|nr:alpha/beta fold hydrolase [Oscillospiraceae bacterium]